ncbi:hypothetical protein ACQPZX_36555 [Actinoplanes sp. CA-142083]|uniref:hypothetical protein n=1 Tax=Actinoplanes sp. CA-142083 TaxID=3239903 RepID=UPI003D90E6BE
MDWSRAEEPSISLVVEIFPGGDEGARWYARHGVPEYWTVDQTPDRDEDDARVQILRLRPETSSYAWERSRLLSELEAEYSAG